jgi:kinetochore protein Mis12/MTW1
LEIENGTHQLETLLCAAIDRNFDKFELYIMQNILCLRPDEPRDWIRLKHYDGLEFDNNTDQGPSVDSVRQLHRRLQASQKLNVMLHTEKARNDQLLGELRALLGNGKAGSGEARKMDLDMSAADEEGDEATSHAPLGFVHDKGVLTAGDAETPLTTTTAFILSQLQALRALSTSLGNILPDLAGQDGERDDKKTWRRERLEYVESATRRHLENVRGLELGEGGEIRDGEWQGDGKARAKGEVDGLERVVTLLGAGPGTAERRDVGDEA